MSKKTSGIQKTIDRAINTISPSWGLKRQNARSEMSAGGYDSGSVSSAIFQEVITRITDADSSVIWDRDRIVERSRDNVRNVPVATGLIKRICDHSIGDRGLALHSQVDREFLGWEQEQAIEWQQQAESIWKYFSESKESDLNREHTIAEKTYLTLQSELEGGDCFTLFANKKRAGSEFLLKLQSIEGEYCSNPNRKTNTDELVEGVQKDKDGSASKYWFSQYHPGDRINFNSNNWDSRKIFDTRGRRNILHHYDKIRLGQTRGIPVLGPVTGKLLQIGRLSNAELMAAVINSFYTIIVQGKVSDTAPNRKNPSADSNLSDDEKLTLGSGSIMRVKPGTEIKSFDPNRPNLDFIKFFESMVAEIGAAVGVPKSLILMSFDKSYSASRGEVLLAWVYFLSKRTHIAVNFCQPTYEALIDEAVSKGMLIAPGYFTDNRIRRAYLGSAYGQWTGPTRPAIDELKEAKAFELFNDMGAMSLQEIITRTTGKDVNRVTDQIAKEHAMRVEAGLESGESEGITDQDITDEENEGNET
jgi:lambda family phage portal protein